MRRLGYAGILLISFSYWAQIYRIIIDRQVAGLSPLFFLLILVGLVLLQVYSYYVRDWVFIISKQGCSELLLVWQYNALSHLAISFSNSLELTAVCSSCLQIEVGQEKSIARNSVSRLMDRRYGQ